MWISYKLTQNHNILSCKQKESEYKCIKAITYEVIAFILYKTVLNREKGGNVGIILANHLWLKLNFPTLHTM